MNSSHVLEFARKRTRRLRILLKEFLVSIVASLRRWFNQSRNPHILFWVMAVLVLVAIWGVTLKLIISERVAAEQTALAYSREQIGTYEAQVGRAVSGIDQTLKFVKYAYELRGQPDVLQRLKAQDLLPPDLLFTVSIADNHGNIVASTRPPTATDITDQNYFEGQRQTGTLLVSRPRPNTGTSEDKLHFSRRLSAADGSFAGIVIVSVDPAYFVSGYESSELGEHGVLAILGSDGVVRVRRSGEVVSVGDVVDYSAVLSAKNEAENEATLSTTPWDGVRRYTIARQLYNLPLAVIVGLSADDQLATTRRDMYTHLWHAVSGSILLILIVTMLSRMSSKLTASYGQLLQSEKMASVGQLAAGVAHEINNPIGFVHSNLSTLTRYVKDIFSVLDAYEQLEPTLISVHANLAPLQALKERVELDYLREDTGNLLTESLEGITRVEKIVVDLKDFSRIDQAEWQYADVRACIETTLNIVSNEIKYKADLVKEYADLPLVECVASQLNQVFLNLLVNASHAIEQHGTITIRTGRKDEEVWISIADTGKGIEPRHLKHIFEPFFTTKPIGAGTGLGLSVSFGIIQRHGGTIKVQSELGTGTTFTIHLPIGQAAGTRGPLEQTMRSSIVAVT